MEENVQLGIVRYVKGAYLVIEGKQMADHFFIIQQGNVKVFNTAGGSGRNQMLGPGDFFGVISAMSSRNQIETAQALSDVVLIKVARAQYVVLIQKNAPLAIKIIKQFSGQLRDLNQTLAKLTLNNTAKDDPSHLFNVAEYYFSHDHPEQAIYSYSKYIKHCPNGENVETAIERLAELASHVGNLKTSFGTNEFNRTYPKDNMIFTEGEPGSEFFIIQRGSVKISKIVDNKELLLAVLKEGDVFGEMALLENKPRVASAMAFEECTLMVVNKANFEHVINNQPHFIAKVTTVLAERIWLIYKQLANTGIIDPMGRVYDALLIQLEKDRVPLNSPASHTFSFGPGELYNMVGLPDVLGDLLLKAIIRDTRIRVIENKIYSASVLEVVRQAEFYRKMDIREKNKEKV